MGERVTAGDACVVEVDCISKKFGLLVAVEPTSFVVPAGELLTLLGPSGSGKTTILKIIAGFEQPTAGMVRIAGGDVTRVPPHKRNLGFVFQQYALFPHLTVAQNIAYPLQMRRIPAAEIQTRVAEALDLIRLRGLEDRRPAQLSGGQQQRVALARAIVFRPPVLLMDEPMSALDKRLREEMQYEIRRLQRQLGITTIAVTHDQTEALVMSDSIIVLSNGRIEQSGSPHEVYKRPSSEFVANFIGESNIFRGVVQRRESGVVLACSNDLDIPLGPSASVRDAAGLAYVVRPESISIGTDPHPGAVHVKARVVDAIFSGDAIRVVAEAGLGSPVIAKLLAREALHVPRPGEEVVLSWRDADATLLPAAANPTTH